MKYIFNMHATCIFAFSTNVIRDIIIRNVIIQRSNGMIHKLLAVLRTLVLWIIMLHISLFANSLCVNSFIIDSTNAHTPTHVSRKMDLLFSARRVTPRSSGGINSKLLAARNYRLSLSVTDHNAANVRELHAYQSSRRDRVIRSQAASLGQWKPPVRHRCVMGPRAR